MSKYSKILAFPNDNKSRVIWWYGPVVKNISDSNIPLVKILTRQLVSNNTLANEVEIFKVSISELDIVRIGTIWKGQERMDNYYSNLNIREYSFDFTSSEPASIRFNEIKTLGSKYIPISAYNLGNLGTKKSTIFQFLNSTITKLTSKNGETILIPSLEFLTSAIAPEHKLIRAELLLDSLDNLLNQYIVAAHINDEYEYVIETHHNHYDSNITLLSYLQLNTVSRSRLSQLYASMEKSVFNDKIDIVYEERYPIVLPYHPSDFLLRGEGIEIGENTFLMLRINAYSLPTNHSIQNITTKYESNPSEELLSVVDKTIPINDDRHKNNFSPITQEQSPHKDAGKCYIKSEVSRIGAHPKIITSIKNKKNHETVSFHKPKEQQITTLSAGDPRAEISLEGIAQIKQSSLKKEFDISNNIRKVIDELNTLTKQNKIKDFSYISQDASKKKDQTFCELSKDCYEKTQNRWHIKNKIIQVNKKYLFVYRKFLIVQIIMHNEECYYLLEIEQKRTEAFFGLIFQVKQKLTSSAITELLQTIAKNKGVFKNRVNKKLVSTKIPVYKSFIYEHRATSSLLENIRRFKKNENT